MLTKNNLLIPIKVRLTDRSPKLPTNCRFWKSLRPVQHWRTVHPDRDEAGQEHWGGPRHRRRQLSQGRRHLPVHPRELHKRPLHGPWSWDSAHVGPVNVRPGKRVPLWEDRAEPVREEHNGPGHLPGVRAGGRPCERCVREGFWGDLPPACQGLCPLLLGQPCTGRVALTVFEQEKWCCCVFDWNVYMVLLQVKREHYKALSHFYTALGLLDHEVWTKYRSLQLTQSAPGWAGEEGSRDVAVPAWHEAGQGWTEDSETCCAGVKEPASSSRWAFFKYNAIQVKSGEDQGCI